jgi:hypothetical protein
MNNSEVTQAMAKASQGLLFRSETDAPFHVFEWPDMPGKPDKAQVLAKAGLPPDTPVKVKGLDAFFRDATTEHEWHNDQEKAEVQQLKQLVEVIKDSLAGIKVFQVGKAECDVYIVGFVGTAWIGLKTKIVET